MANVGGARPAGARPRRNGAVWLCAASRRAKLASPALGPEVLWVRLTLRVLAGAVGVLIVCAALEWPHLRDARPLEPGVENTVAQIVWAL